MFLDQAKHIVFDFTSVSGDDDFCPSFPEKFHAAASLGRTISL